MADEPPPIDVEGTEEEPVEQKDTPKTEEPTQEVSLEDPEPKKGKYNIAHGKYSLLLNKFYRRGRVDHLL